MSITFQREEFTTFRQETELFLQHWNETTSFREHLPLDIDWEKYTSLNEHDLLHIITAKDGEKIVAYMVYVIGENFHYKGKLIANNDTLFVIPEYRKQGLAQKLIKYCEQYLYERGVDVVTMHAKTTNKLSELLQMMGYKIHDIQLSKCLGE